MIFEGICEHGTMQRSNDDDDDDRPKLGVSWLTEYTSGIQMKHIVQYCIFPL